MIVGYRTLINFRNKARVVAPFGICVSNTCHNLFERVFPVSTMVYFRIKRRQRRVSNRFIFLITSLQ